VFFFSFLILRRKKIKEGKEKDRKLREEGSKEGKERGKEGRKEGGKRKKYLMFLLLFSLEAKPTQAPLSTPKVCLQDFGEELLD
jgi:hypothetical protein